MDGKGGKCIQINQLAEPSIEDQRMEVFLPPNQRVEHLAGKRIGFKQKQANFPNTNFPSYLAILGLVKWSMTRIEKVVG